MLSVIIPTRNRALELERCIKSIKNQTYKKFEIIVVDDKSTDNTPSIINQYKVRYIRNKKNLGQSSAQNIGAKIAKGNILVFIDDDCIPDKYWLEHIAKAFKISKNTAVVGGKIVNLGKTKFNIHLLPFWPYINYWLNNTGKIISFGIITTNFGSNLPQFVDWISCGNMAIKKEVFTKVGGFDKNFIGNSAFADPDICSRINDLGYKIYYQPLSICVHKPSLLNRKTPGEIRFYNKSNEMYFQIKRLNLEKPFNLILFFVYHIWDFTIETVGLLKSKYCIYNLKGKIDGLKRSL